MSSPLGERLFTFAVISDTHVNEGEDRSASPYRSNRLANGRFRFAVRSLNVHRPDFVIHLGDMGNPLPRLGTYEQAAESFRALAAGLTCPLRLIPGNHCVGDKPTGWTPVPRVDTDALERYSRVYGKHYYSFRHRSCHFVTLDSLLINSGTAAEARQRRWIEKDLARASDAGERLWLFMHYPPFIASPDELGSYDNLDEPGRTWLLGLFERFEIEAAYSGHVHNYFYNRYAGTEIYTVPALSFVRQDYSELYPVEPDDGEGGRNDVAKLGYLLVDVHEDGYHHRLVRTYGEVTPADTSEGSSPPPPSIAAPPDAPGRARLGVEMRESWLSTVALRTNNSVSPFIRRRARNDWAVLALQEMGISKVRLPLPELASPDVAERVSILQDAGLDFTVYSHGIPSERHHRLIREHRALLAGWELILDLADAEAAARRLAKISDRLSRDVPCYLNPLRTSLLEIAGAPPGDAGQGNAPRSAVDSANVKHEANYGFHATDGEVVRELAANTVLRNAFRGFVFRNRRRGGPGTPPSTAIRRVSELGRETGMYHQVHLLFSGNLTSERLVDDLDTANRVAEAAFAAQAVGDVELIFDTFEDVDRGYFVRHGLVDRRYNPRPAARVLRTLLANTATYDLSRLEGWRTQDLECGRLLGAFLPEASLFLLLPDGAQVLHEIELESIPCERLHRVDLADGYQDEILLRKRDRLACLAAPLEVEHPTLLVARRRL